MIGGMATVLMLDISFKFLFSRYLTTQCDIDYGTLKK